MSRDVQQSGDLRDESSHAWYQIDRVGDCAVVHAGGEIDANTVQAFHETETEAASEASRVVIDLADVTFVDSSGLGALIAARRSARESGGSLVLVSPPPLVRRLLGSTHLDDVFAIYDSLDEAIINGPRQQ